MIHDPERLRRVFGGPEWFWLRQRLREQLAKGRALPARCTLRQPNAEQRQTANRLFGTPGVAGPVHVYLDSLITIFQEAGLCDSIEAALVCCDGPIPDLLAERGQERARWTAVDTAARATLTDHLKQLPRLTELGLWQRLSAGDDAQAHQWIRDLARLQQLLLQDRDWQLAELAATITGNAHALDRGMPLARLALLLQHGADADADILSWRRSWQALRVQPPATSGAVLTLGLRWRGPLAASWNQHAELGEPLRVTASSLERGMRLDPPPRIHCCENPSVLEIAARCLSPPPPMICLEGQASAAGLLLLAQSGDAELRYHGDYDWPGLQIANGLMRRFPNMQAWRFDSDALRRHLHLPGPPLLGHPCEADWDAALAPLLAQRGRALHEESVLGDLFEILEDAAHSGPS